MSSTSRNQVSSNAPNSGNSRVMKSSLFIKMLESKTLLDVQDVVQGFHQISMRSMSELSESNISLFLKILSYIFFFFRAQEPASIREARLPHYRRAGS